MKGRSDRRFAEIHRRRCEAEFALANLTYDIGKRDFADVNTRRALWLESRISPLGALLKPNLRSADAGIAGMRNGLSVSPLPVRCRDIGEPKVLVDYMV
ncbi:hypothetical protein AJ88_15530 [Mesorhizobium amorphae CCBAU 01583]|nr:hypothetical protein AJ88_15530 [Mesorhizobium amorphae CCBAU 01583]